MEIVERFAALLSRAPDDVPLDETALLIAARARGAAAVDVDASLRTLDDLAHRCSEPTFAGLRTLLFEKEGFTGNVEHYGDPDNSYLDRVLDRRTGIPITLSIVMIEVGRRLGVPVVGIGMPAHFLVRDGDSDRYCDPFGGGRVLDVDGCAALFATVTGNRVQFDESLLVAVPPPLVLARMLNNLEHGPLSADPMRLGALLDLHVRIPLLGPTERVAVASRLAGVGRFAQAAAFVEAIDGETDGDELRRHARAFRARLN
jgi:regulator of sirC expression with transglutaminase-like and TPR domain